MQPRSDLQAPHTRIFCFVVQRSASGSHQALHASTAHCLWSLQAAQQSRGWLLLAPWQKSDLGLVRPQRLQSVGFRIASHILQCSFGLVALCSKSPVGFVVPQPVHSRFFCIQARHRRILLLSARSSYSSAFFSFPHFTQVFVFAAVSVGSLQCLQSLCCCWLNGISRGRGVVQPEPAQ